MDRFEGRCRLDWWVNRSTNFGDIEVSVVITPTGTGWDAHGQLVHDDEREALAFLCGMDPGSRQWRHEDWHGLHPMSHSANGAPLTEQVREILRHVLGQADFPGSEELLQQASRVNVVGGPVTMLDLRVTMPTSASAFTDGPIPLSVIVLDTAGAAFGELLIWVNDGYLSSLEMAWWSDDPPGQLPTLDRVRVARK